MLVILTDRRGARRLDACPWGRGQGAATAVAGRTLKIIATGQKEDPAPTA
jgi:hypothetical protein